MRISVSEFLLLETIFDVSLANLSETGMKSAVDAIEDLKFKVLSAVVVD